MAAMDVPPQIFVAGRDALAAIAPAVQARLDAMRAHAALSTSTDGAH
jgi:hypothetical protein